MILFTIFTIPELQTKERTLESGRKTDIKINYQIEKLESLQNQAGRAWKGTNRDKRNEELGWEHRHFR